MSEKEPAEAFSCESKPCPAWLLFEYLYPAAVPLFDGWLRFHRGWHGRDAEIQRLTAERDGLRDAARAIDPKDRSFAMDDALAGIN